MPGPRTASAPARPPASAGSRHGSSRSTRPGFELALTGIDLLCWTQHLLLDGPLTAAEPKKLRYRLLHVAGKLSRTARTTTLRVAAGWPWTNDLIRAFERLAVLPEPVT